jgi:hypothetical protein
MDLGFVASSTIAGYMTRSPILSEADDFPRIMGLPGGGEAPVGEPWASPGAAVQ